MSSKLEDLISMLNEKKDLLIKISDLTNMQKDSISKEDVDKLTSLISEKDTLIKRIIEVDDNFKETYDGLKAELGVDSLEKSGSLPRDLLVTLKESTREIMGIINDITEADNENKTNAQSLKDKFAKEVRKVNTSKQATSAYFGKSAVFQNSYYIDSKK